MSDQRLRELEARWRASGSGEDEVAWLTERVRNGERLDWQSYLRLALVDPPTAAEYLDLSTLSTKLTPERVRLAARYGHLPANELLTRDGGYGANAAREETLVPEIGYRELICEVARWALHEHSPDRVAAEAFVAAYAAVEEVILAGGVNWQHSGEALATVDSLNGLETDCALAMEASTALLYIFERPDLSVATLQAALGEGEFNRAFVARLLAPAFAEAKAADF